MTIDDAIKRLEQMRQVLHQGKKLNWPTKEIEAQYGLAVLDDDRALSMGIGALQNLVRLRDGTPLPDAEGAAK